MSSRIFQQLLGNSYDSMICPFIDISSGQCFPGEEDLEIAETAGVIGTMPAYVLSATVSWTRTALVKEVLPIQRAGIGIREDTTTICVIISYKYPYSPNWRIVNPEPADAWRAIEEDQVSRPISSEEIIRRQADEFLEQVYRLDSSNNLQAATDKVFDYIDRLLSLGIFDVCNEILKRAQVERLSTALMRSLLTITFAAKRHLRDREDFFERVEKEMTIKRGPDVTNRLLGRLA